tara:strand:- start:3660 stop:4184 length:525 start_codon:yes stop_codon:yes gene_type:complete
MMQIADIIFYLTGLVTLTCALMVILTKDIFRAALFLAATFLGVVALFILLFAEFLAAVQLIIYVGAISVVIVFAIMLTKNVEIGNPFSNFKITGFLLGLSMCCLLIISISVFDWDNRTKLEPNEMEIVVNTYQNSIYYIGKILVSNLVVPFIASSFILLAAVLGAISLVKERTE